VVAGGLARREETRRFIQERRVGRARGDKTGEGVLGARKNEGLSPNEDEKGACAGRGIRDVALPRCPVASAHNEPKRGMPEPGWNRWL